MSPDANLEVDGCTLQLDFLSCSVSFSTSTDALFASFILKHHTVPWQIFDELLSILHLDGFNNKELKFKKLLDVYMDIADRRRSMAAKREHLSEPSEDGQGQTRAPSVPKLVVELVADELEQERASHIDKQLERSLSVAYSLKDVDEALQNMSLVHRTWTGIAQQKLRKYINIPPSKDTSLRSRLLNLHIGPWVREVWFGGHFLGGWGAEENSDEELLLLRVILQRCPNIKFLLIGKASYSSPQWISREAILQLRNLNSLEHLWIYRGVSEQDFSELCISVISELHSLKGLYISDDSFWQNSASPRNLIGGSPNESLRRLSLTSHSEYDQSRWLPICSHLSWLFVPRNGYNPKILELNANDVLGSSESVSRFIEALEPLMPSIESLHLRHTARSTSSSRTDVFQRFTSLQQLQLHDVQQAPEMPLCLPTTIREFHIRFGSMYSSWHTDYPTLDTYIVSQLQIMPNLREVLISVEGGTTDTLPSTASLCANRFINLILT